MPTSAPCGGPERHPRPGEIDVGGEARTIVCTVARDAAPEGGINRVLVSGDDGNRTHDLLLAKQMLYQLSYVPEKGDGQDSDGSELRLIWRSITGTQVCDSGGMSAPADLTIDRSATVERTDLDAGSWVELATGFVRDAAGHMDALHDEVAWQQTEVLRYDQYVPDQRLSAGLRSADQPLLRQTELHLTSRWRVKWDGWPRCSIGTATTGRGSTATAA